MLLRENEMAAFKKFVRCSKTTDPKQSYSYIRSDVIGSTTENNQEEKRGYCYGCNY
jgi:hypothetical protein